MNPPQRDSSPVWGSEDGAWAWVRTRLQPPRRGRGILPRPRLEDLAPKLMAQTLTVIKAPPGFGKTTLAAAWFDALTAQGVAGAWLTLEGCDDTAPALLRGMWAAWQRALPADVPVDLPADLSAQTLAASLVNGIHHQAQPSLMVIDDCHLISEQTWLTALRMVLRHAPAPWHLLLIGRHDLPAALMQQVQGDPAWVIDAERLRFTPGETQALLKRSAQAPSLSELARVQDVTCGWSAALRAYLLAVRKHPQSALATLPRAVGPVFDEMLAGLAPPLRRSVLKLGVLTSFNPDLLQHCLNEGASDAAQTVEADALLDTLTRQQFFLSAQGPHGDWFSLHPLLREHLRCLIEREDPAQAQAVRMRAAHWLAAQGHWSQAIEQALAAGQSAQAQAWMSPCAMDLVEQGEFLVLLQWQNALRMNLATLPAAMRLALAWAAALAMQHEEARRLLAELPDEGPANHWEREALQAMLLAMDDRAADGAALAATCLPHLGHRPWIGNVLINVRRHGLLQSGQWHALYSLPPLQVKPLSRTRYTFNRLYQHCMEAMADTQQANLAGAAARLDGALIELNDSGASSPALRAFPAAFLARVRLLQGRTAEATALLADSLEHVRMGGFLDSMAAAMLSSATVLRLQGSLTQARQRVDEMEALAHHRRWPRLLAMALLERCRISLQEARLQEARACCHRLRQLRDQGEPIVAVDGVFQSDMLAALALAGACGECDPTLMRDAENLAHALGQAQMTLAQLTVQMAMADALLRQGQRELAEQKWATWRDAVLQSGAVALLASLPEVWREEVGVAPDRVDALQGLTVKERLILQGVAKGQSNKMIAKALGVTPETIKTHLKSVFTKLGVHSRTHAAALMAQPAIHHMHDFG